MPSPSPSLPVVPNGMADVAAGVPVRVWNGRPAAGHAPLVVHFHAGTFVAGGVDGAAPVSALLAAAGAVVVDVAYPLAPAHPFPAAIEAGHAVLSWAHRRRTRLAGRGAGLWLVGEEAGGNLAAAVALMARDRDGPPLEGQILLSPMVDPCVATASLRDAHAGPVGCRWADGWKQYLSRAADFEHPYAAPGRALRVGEVPATLLITAQDDPLRDETLSYAQRLQAAGVPVDTVVLDAPTGWPCSLMQAAAIDAPWAAELRERCRRFLFAAGAPAAAPAPSSSSPSPSSSSSRSTTP